MVLIARKLNGEFFRAQSFGTSDDVELMKRIMISDAGEELEFTIVPASEYD